MVAVNRSQGIHRYNLVRVGSLAKLFAADLGLGFDRGTYFEVMFTFIVYHLCAFKKKLQPLQTVISLVSHLAAPLHLVQIGRPLGRPDREMSAPTVKSSS